MIRFQDEKWKCEITFVANSVSTTVIRGMMLTI